MKRTHPERAFSLVELLVVIGIVAVLIGLLLPVISGVQERGRDLKCKSNLRQIVQATFSYANEHKGSLPFGFYYRRSDPVSWRPLGGDTSYICWPYQVARYMGAGVSGESNPGELPAVFRCPEAEQVMPHLLSYVMNMIVAVNPPEELSHGWHPRTATKPPVMTQLLKETVLLWDTAIQPGFDRPEGFLIGLDIDDQRFWLGAEIPQFRYYSISDPFSRMLGGVLGNNRPIRLDVKMFPWRNIDPAAQTGMPFQGNLRFRHQRQTVCNAGFSDGSVRQFTVKLKGDQSALRVDALRRYFMIKWPPGVPPDYTRPW